MEVSETSPRDEAAFLAVEWFENKFQSVLTQVEASFEQYRISEALMAIYKLVWDDFCSWFWSCEARYQQPINAALYDSVIALLEENLKLLHPFMPFITEEIWQQIKRTTDEALIIAQYPESKPYDSEVIAAFEFTSGLFLLFVK